MSLNSTMVRLKPIEVVKNITFMALSQFHYGSIKTKQLELIKWQLNASQFHYGSIKTLEKNKQFSLSINVSIPLWFD